MPTTPSRRAACIAAALLLAACSAPADESAAAAAVDTAAAPSTAPRLADSLAYRSADGTELWFTDARTGTSKTTGAGCIERVMEVRRDTLRMPVPLLYTGERPVRVDDTLAAVHIWLDCAPGNLYRVNLRNGQPIYVGRTGG